MSLRRDLQDGLRLLAGVSLHALASAAGAALMGYKRSGTGAVSQTAANKFSRTVIDPEEFGAAGDYDPVTEAGTDDTTALQNAIDSVDGPAIVRLTKKYKTTSKLIGKAGVTLEFRCGAHIYAYLNGASQCGIHGKSGFNIVGQGNGEGVTVFSSGTPGIQAGDHCAILYGELVGAANTVASPSQFHDPGNFRVSGLTLSTDKWIDVDPGAPVHMRGAPGIQLLGCHDFDIKNISIPDSPKMAGAVLYDWGEIGGITTEKTNAAQTANKTAYDLGTRYTVATRNGRISCISFGVLSAPADSSTDIGSFGVRGSGSFNVVVDDVTGDSVTYRGFVWTVGDLGSEFAPAEHRALIGKGNKFLNCRVEDEIGGEVGSCESYADNLADAIADGYVAMTDPLVETDVVFEGIQGRGADTAPIGFRIERQLGGTFREIFIDGFVNPIFVGNAAYGVDLIRPTAINGQQDGILVDGATTPAEDILVEAPTAYANGQAGGDYVGAHFHRSKRPILRRGRLGKVGEASQKFGYRIGAGAEDALVEYPKVLGFKAGGGESFIQAEFTALTRAGVGYATAGGAVTQAASRTTGVTLNKLTGAITLVSAAGSTTPASFTVTNSKVAATDTIILSQKSGTDKYDLSVSAVADGSFEITFNTKSGATVEQPVFNFVVIKGAVT